MIKAVNIRKSYQQLQVLKGVSLEIAKGELVSIVGKSGAGKSTLLHILGTLDQADEGELWVDGQNCGEMKKKALSRFRNEQIGFVFQFHHLLPEFTALENVCMPAFIKKRQKNRRRKRLKSY